MAFAVTAVREDVLAIPSDCVGRRFFEIHLAAVSGGAARSHFILRWMYQCRQLDRQVVTKSKANVLSSIRRFTLPTATVIGPIDNRITGILGYPFEEKVKSCCVFPERKTSR